MYELSMGTHPKKANLILHSILIRKDNKNTFPYLKLFWLTFTASNLLSLPNTSWIPSVSVKQLKLSYNSAIHTLDLLTCSGLMVVRCQQIKSKFSYRWFEHPIIWGDMIDPRKKFDHESSSEVCQMMGYSNQWYGILILFADAFCALHFTLD